MSLGHRVVILIAVFLIRRVLGKLKAAALRTPTLVDDDIVDALEKVIDLYDKGTLTAQLGILGR